MDHVRERILQAYEDRKRRNSSYSKRAFARDLGTSIGRISDILSGESAIGVTLAYRFAKALRLSEKDTQIFVEDVQQGRKRHATIEKTLSQEVFNILQHPIHFSLLALTQTKDFRFDEDWIAQRLDSDPKTIAAAIDRLSDTDIIRFEAPRKIALNFNSLTTSTDIPSASLRRSHQISMERAIQSLETVALDQRDITSITMPINLRKIPAAKRLIKDFRRRLSKVLESGPKDEVYELNIQLVPVSKKTSGDF